MNRLGWGLVLVVGTAMGQVYQHNGWPAGCTDTGITTGYAVSCTPDNQYPLGTFSVPAAGVDFYDPMGTRSFIMASTAGQETAYTARPSVSKNGKYCLFYASSAWQVYNCKTKAFVRALPSLGNGIDRTNLSVLDEEVVYGVTNTSPGTLVKYNIAAGGAGWTTVATLNGTGGRPTMTQPLIGGTGNISSDDHMAVYSTTEAQVCVVKFDGVTNPLICASYSGDQGASSPDYAYVTQGTDSVTSRRYVMLWYLDSTFTLFWYDDGFTALTRLGKVTPPYFGNGGHQGIGHTADNKQFLLRSCPDVSGSGRWLCQLWFKDELNMSVAGNATILHKFSPVDDARASIHAGCSATKVLCVVEYYGKWNGTAAASRQITDTTSPYAPNSYTWLIETIEDLGTATPSYRIAAMNRNVWWSDHLTAPADYYITPRTSMSHDGRWITYDSYFGYPASGTRRTVFGYIGVDRKAVRVNRNGTQARWVAPSVTGCTWKVAATIAGLASPLESGTATGGGNEQVVTIATVTTPGTYWLGVTCGGYQGLKQYTRR